MNLCSITYVITKEVRNRTLNNKGFKDPNDIITNIDYDFKPDFDSSNNHKFDLILSKDYKVIDNNIEVDY